MTAAPTCLEPLPLGMSGCARDLLAPPRVRAVVLIVLVLSIALRLFFIGFAEPVARADARDYDAFARSLAAGEGYKQVYRGERLAYRGFTFYAYRTPGYPAALVGWYGLVGWHQKRAMLLNLIADLWTDVCVLLIARRLVGRTGALVAHGLWGLQALWTTALMSESLLTCLLLTEALLLVFGRPYRSLRQAFLFGVVTVAAIFVRPIGGCGLLVALVQLLRHRGRPRALLAAVMVLPCLVSLGLWSVRNYRIFGQVVVLSTNLGRHNAPSFGIDFDEVYTDLRAQGRNEAQIDDHLKALIRRRIEAEPLAAVRLYLSRLAGLFTIASPSDAATLLLWRERFLHAPAWVQDLHRALYYQYYPVYFFALVGMISMLRRWRRDGEAGELLALLATYVLIHGVVSVGNVRYAAPLYPLLAILAATGVMTAVRRVRQSGSSPAEASPRRETRNVAI